MKWLTSLVCSDFVNDKWVSLWEDGGQSLRLIFSPTITMIAPLVSIIMPSYNNRAYLATAITSVLTQTHNNLELIICDDGSQDDSYDILQQFALLDRRITVLRNPANLGTAKTRQRLLDHCHGKYVGHVDCDDFLERWAIEEVVKVFVSDPALALVYSDSANLDTSGKVIGYRLEPDYSYRNLANLGWRHFGMYKRSLAIRYGGYNTRLPSCEDGDLFMKIASRHPCHHLAKVLYYYRCHDSNTSRRNKKCDSCEAATYCNYYTTWQRVVKEFYPETPSGGG